MQTWRVGVTVLLQLRTGSVRLKATQTYPVRFGHKVASLHIEAVLPNDLTCPCLASPAYKSHLNRM